MSGCCPPEGIRALHTAWTYAVTKQREGIFVNLCFNRETDDAKVYSFLPWAGRTSVVTKKPENVFIRVPAWVPQGEALAYRNSRPVRAEMQGPYVKFPNARVGEDLTVTYPLVEFSQSIEVGDDLRRESFTLRWLGNTLVAVEPKGAYMPMFANTPRKIRPYTAVVQT